MYFEIRDLQVYYRAIHALKGLSLNVEKGEIVGKTATKSLSLTYDYIRMNDIMKLIRDFSAHIEEQQFDNLCKIRILVKRGEIERFCSEIEPYVSTIEK